MKKVVVLGGGILGLTLAYKLSKLDYQVTILEKSPGFGGLASGFEYDGFSIERYYHHWFRSDVYVQNLLKELGIGDKLAWHDTTSGIWDKNRLYDFSTSIDVLKLPILNIFQRLRLGFVSLFLQKTKDYKKFEDVTALEWCDKYFGTKVTNVLWRPLLNGKFGKYSNKISMSWLWARIFDRSSSRPNPLAKEKLGYIDGGFQLMVDKLVDGIKSNGGIMLSGVQVTSHKKEQQHVINYVDANQAENRLEADLVVSTVPGPVFTKLFNVSEEYKKQIKQVKYIGATCMLIFLKHKLMPYYWLSVTNEDAPFMAVIEHTNLIDKSKYNDKHIVYIAKYIDPNEELFTKDEEQLLDVYENYLKQINPEFDRSWIEEKFLFKSGFAQHIVEQNYNVVSYETGIEGLLYANFSQIYPHDRGTN
ncbi:NAD(P)/FAD-dependent oxidoreductase, partial [Candidatus Dojkabacteria bacterium]|nr:NAD(P)/FAD-dependent oxidoreductase [Candidatus Dojkabacteria bacterium]